MPFFVISQCHRHRLQLTAIALSVNYSLALTAISPSLGTAAAVRRFHRECAKQKRGHGPRRRDTVGENRFLYDGPGQEYDSCTMVDGPSPRMHCTALSRDGQRIHPARAHSKPAP